MKDCEACGLETGDQKWLRIFPGYDRLRLGPRCAARFALEARDRGRGPADHGRLVGIALWLAGEVWDTPAGEFWFQEPFMVRRDALNAVDLRLENDRRT